MTVKTYSTKYTIVKVSDKGLHIQHCKCGNQLHYLLSNTYDTCNQNNFDCKKCGGRCSGLERSWETGYMERTVHGYCKQCGSYIEYST